MKKIFLVLSVFFVSAFAQAKNCTVSHLDAGKWDNGTKLGSFDAPLADTFSPLLSVDGFVMVQPKGKEKGLLVKCKTNLVTGFGNMPVVTCVIKSFDSIADDKPVYENAVSTSNTNVYGRGLGTIDLVYGVNGEGYEVFCF